MASLATHFFDGGEGMYPILVCSIVMLAAGLLAISRLWAPRPDAERMLAEIERALARGDVDGAILVALASDRAAGRIALAGLRESLHRAGRAEAALASALSAELPALRVGQSALRATTQLATLLGLLGTVTGLRVGFSCMAPSDEYSRASALAHGISDALNCNAFGLFVSTLSLALAWITHARGEMLRAELELVARGVANRIRAHHVDLRWLGQRPELERPTYRVAA